MKFISLSYVRSNDFHDPASWWERIKPYGRVLEALAKHHAVISIEQIDYEGHHQLNGVQYYFIQLKNRTIPTSLHQLVKSLAPDVVVVHGFSFPMQVIQLRRTLGKEVMILLQYHADRIPTGWRSWIQKIADRHITGYLFTSKNTSQPWIAQKLIAGPEKVKEVMVGASTFQQENKDDVLSITNVKGHPVFLFVGRVDNNKDPFTLVKGFKTFAVSHPRASLYLILQTMDRVDEVLRMITEIQGSKNIFVIEKIPHQQMQAWYNSADFIISTSYAEAFGMAVAEAMSCGCFPIVTNIPSFGKLTHDGTCGILFEPGNASQLAAALEQASQLDLDTARKKILNFYQTHLSAAAIAGQICNAVAQLKNN